MVTLAERFCRQHNINYLRLQESLERFQKLAKFKLTEEEIDIMATDTAIFLDLLHQLSKSLRNSPFTTSGVLSACQVVTQDRRFFSLCQGVYTGEKMAILRRHDIDDSVVTVVGECMEDFQKGIGELVRERPRENPESARENPEWADEKLRSGEDVRITAVKMKADSGEYASERAIFSRNKRMIGDLCRKLGEDQKMINRFLKEQTAYAQRWKEFLGASNRFDYGVTCFVDKCVWYSEQSKGMAGAKGAVLGRLSRLYEIIGRVNQMVVRTEKTEKSEKNSVGQSRAGKIMGAVNRFTEEIVTTSTVIICGASLDFFEGVSGGACSVEEVKKQYAASMALTESAIDQ